MTTPGSTTHAFLTCVALALLAAACDNAFEPIAEGEVHFSVFGYLDAAADTQWVRVMPIRPLSVTTPGAYGVDVTLQDVATGRRVALRDSLFRFSDYTHDQLGSEGLWVHDFWTTEPIEPGATYRFAALRPGQDPAEATVAVPEDYAVEVWLLQHVTGAPDLLRVVGAPHVPFLVGYTHFTDGCGAGVDSVRYEADPDGQGTSTVAVPWRRLTPRVGCGSPKAGRQEIRVVASTAAWPAGDAFSPWGLAPERVSNVSNAVGFLGGALTKVVPWEQCSYDTDIGPAPDYCVLRYDDVSASVAGTVTETRCADGPIAEVTVQLRELVAPPAVPRIREVTTDERGAFSIGALDPDVGWALRARAKPVPIFGQGEIDIYALHYDTLGFAPGARARYDIGLPRLTPCDQKP